MEHPFFKEGRQPENGKNTTVQLTAAAFFGEENLPQYASKADFIAYGEGLKPKEANDLAKLITNMHCGLKMNGNPYAGVDNLGKPYTWHEFVKPKALAGFKIINGGGIPALISDYQDGKIAINFTLDDLIQVAREN